MGMGRILIGGRGYVSATDRLWRDLVSLLCSPLKEAVIGIWHVQPADSQALSQSMRLVTEVG